MIIFAWCSTCFILSLSNNKEILSPIIHFPLMIIFAQCSTCFYFIAEQYQRDPQSNNPLPINDYIMIVVLLVVYVIADQ